MAGHTFEWIITTIRDGVYGRDVRNAIAEGMEMMKEAAESVDSALNESDVATKADTKNFLDITDIVDE